MLDLDLWKEIFSTLKQNRLRSFMTAFGVFWGIFMLIIMSGAGRALENGVMEEVDSFATNSAFFWTDRTSIPYKGFQRGRIWNLDNNDIDYIKKNLKEVEYISPRLFSNQPSANNTVRGERTGSFAIYGEFPEFFKIDTWTPIKGRLINDIDVLQKRKVCTIGERVAEVMFENDDDPIGEYLRLDGVYYQVVGVLHPETTITIGDGEKVENIYIPFSTMQTAYNYGNTVHFFSVTANVGTSVSNLQRNLLKILKERHKISPDDLQAVSSFNIEAEFKKYTALFLGIRVLTWIVGIGTLLAGVIGVSNIMLVIIKERTQEIGIQRAIGATPAKIITHIVAESVFLTVMAGYIGLSLGVGILELLNKAIEAAGDEIFFRHPEVNLTMALSALAVLVISGIFAGLIPARRAIRIKPIDALRNEK